MTTIAPMARRIVPRPTKAAAKNAERVAVKSNACRCQRAGTLGDYFDANAIGAEPVGVGMAGLFDFVGDIFGGGKKDSSPAPAAPSAPAPPGPFANFNLGEALGGIAQIISATRGDKTSSIITGQTPTAPGASSLVNLNTLGPTVPITSPNVQPAANKIFGMDQNTALMVGVAAVGVLVLALKK